MSENNKPAKKRIEYRGKNLRVSRTGGISATKTFSGDSYGATINTKHGLRLHKRIMKGARIGFQRGNFQFIGHYKSGPFNFNIFKGGVSTSIKNKRGTYNIFKPNYSSFKLRGVQVRGKNAATLQLLFLAFGLLMAIFKLSWYLSKTIFWFVFLSIKWVVDFFIGFYRGYRSAV